MTNSEPLQRDFDGKNSVSPSVRFRAAAVALVVFAVLATITAPGASAISDGEELTQFGSFGSGAGQLRDPLGIATDPVTGHVLTTENGNHRISEFTPWGNFVKAFGWDVAPGAVNEQQEVRVRAAAGQFKLTFESSTTPDLAFDAPGSEGEGPGSVEAALNALPSIGGAGGSVSVSKVAGTPDGKSPYIYVVAFKGSLAGANVDPLAIASGATPPSGGVPSSSLEVRTRADGTAGGTGLESCTAESGCKAGLEGSGVGQFALVRGLAVDTGGNVYVKESDNLRVQKFDPAGRFLLMFGGEVNKTTGGDICPLASGDECRVGAAGSTPGWFGEGLALGGIAFSAGKLFVGDIERIQRFNSAGEYEASIPVSGGTVTHLAIAPGGGDFYASVGVQNIRKLDLASGDEIGQLGEPGEFTATQPPVAVDPSGNVFVVVTGPNSLLASSVKQFDSAGKQISEFGTTAEFGGGIEALGTNPIGSLYVAYRGSGKNFIRIFGPAPAAFEGPPQVPPTISAQFATSVGRDDATVAADINPHFWTDAHYYVEYGTGKCSQGGCQEVKPVPPGALLTSKVLAEPLQSAGIALEGLQRETTYHYRFVAESSGGGPVRGVGGEVGADGAESTFTTYPLATSPKVDCPNQAFRTGFSAPLPDCRAFEMVSPVDKNNGDIKVLLDNPGFPTALSQSAEGGGRFTYSSYRAFANPQGAPYASQYLATRKGGVGWSSEALDVAQTTDPVPLASGVGWDTFENPYKAFSADLCESWLMVAAEPVLAPGAVPGYRDIYRRDGCGEGGYEALVGVKPTVDLAGEFYPVLQGASADGDAGIFAAEDKLTDDASSKRWQAYYASAGRLRLLCIGVNGLASGGNCTAGSAPLSAMAGEAVRERSTVLTHAISDDGSKVYWTDTGGEKTGGPGKVYLRLNPGEEQSEVSGGACTEADKACTVPVSETAVNKASRFWAASADGSKALFEVTEGAQAGNLYLFDLEEGGSTLIAGEGLGVVGASEDLSRIYFISEEVLPETSGATAGKPNIYLDQEGVKSFVATISAGDAAGVLIPSNAPAEAIFHAARVSPDGRVLAFISTESLTGYDSTDQISGKADSEVYLYEVGAAGPVCVSCNPSRERPLGRLVEGVASSPAPLATAGWLTMPEGSLYSAHVLSADGDRLFFNSFDALLPRDTNGKGDVYEWEAASGANKCKEQGAELYVPSAAGCLSLISSGQSPNDSEFLDASADGSDAFFTTSSSLLPQDPGLIDVYDARENGGLPAPPPSPGPCQGEACQLASSPPNDPTPASASFRGAGNPKPTPRCRKGKVARKGRCVAKKGRQAKKRHNGVRAANHNRGANR